MIVNVYGKSIHVTQETIAKTRLWFAYNARICVEKARLGTFKVNDIELYQRQQESTAQHFLNGELDYSLTFIQRAIFFQTGISVPLLS